MSVAQDRASSVEELTEEGRFTTREKERAQSAAISTDSEVKDNNGTKAHFVDRDFEGGFGGQEDLEDRYATTSGEH